MAAALASAAGIAHVRPDLRPGANAFIGHLVRVPWEFGAQRAYLFAPFIAALEVVVGCGVWMLKGWARLVLLLDHGAPLVLLAVALLLSAFHPSLFSPIPRTPYFVAGFVVNVLIVMYLFHPDVADAFRPTD